MANSELALMAHLFRRGGFGATRDELETHVAQGYQETVEQLLHPDRAPVMDEDILRRYLIDQNSFDVDRKLPGLLAVPYHQTPSVLSKRRWPCSGTACLPRPTGN